VDFCKKEGCQLLPVNPASIPRFKLNLEKINYPLLICKALYIDTAHDGYMEEYEFKKDSDGRLQT